MKIKNRIRAGIVLLALALGLTACGGSSSSTASSAASSAPASSVSESVSAEPESTSAAPESAVSTEASPLDGIKFSVSKVRNDNTGNWRISLIAENIDMSEYALDYYKQYFTDDSEIHFIVNFNYNTTTKIMNMGGQLDVTVQDYVPKEEQELRVHFPSYSPSSRSIFTAAGGSILGARGSSSHVLALWVGVTSK